MQRPIALVPFGISPVRTYAEPRYRGALALVHRGLRLRPTEGNSEWGLTPAAPPAPSTDVQARSSNLFLNFGWAALASMGLAVVFSAGCDGGDDTYGGAGYYGYCQQFTSCGECTPIVGCGWCTYGQGQGVCLRDPNACRTPQFTWTWEPSACGNLADASIDAGAAGDANPEDSSDAIASSCHWPTGADTFHASEAGASGCLPGASSNLCSSSQYTLTCYGAGTASPDAALDCAVVPVPTPMNVLFYCCPCVP